MSGIILLPVSWRVEWCVSWPMLTALIAILRGCFSISSSLSILLGSNYIKSKIRATGSLQIIFRQDPIFFFFVFFQWEEKVVAFWRASILIRLLLSKRTISIYLKVFLGSNNTKWKIRATGKFVVGAGNIFLGVFPGVLCWRSWERSSFSLTPQSSTRTGCENRAVQIF